MRITPHAVLLSLSLALLSLAQGAAGDTIVADGSPSWEERKLRIFIARSNQMYRDGISSEQMQQIADSGVNVFGHRWGHRDEAAIDHALDLCEAHGLHYAPWMRGSVRGEPEDPSHRIVWSSGEVQPLAGPLTPELWNELEQWIIHFAEQSVDRPVVGVMLDFENYADNKQANLYSVSYDVYSLNRFAELNGAPAPPDDLTAEDARAWFEAQDDPQWSDYDAWFVEEYRQRWRALRERVDQINPRFLFMGYSGHARELTGEVMPQVVGTPEAPYVVLGTDYGRPAELFDESTSLAVDEGSIRQRVERWRQRDDVHALVTGGTLPGYRASEPEYHGKKLSLFARESDGYWIWAEDGIAEQTEQWFDWMKRANQDIDVRTYELPSLPRQTPEPAGEFNPQHPDRKQAAIIGDMRGAFGSFLRDHLDYEVHRLNGASRDYLRNFDLIVLQGFNAPEAARESLGPLLEDYVSEGGALLLAYTTISRFGSPFTEIAEGPAGIPDDAQGRRDYQVRHRTRRIVPDDSRLREGVDDAAFYAHYPYHEPIAPGPAGTVLTENTFGQPVTVSGTVGEGRVAIAGDHLGRRRMPDGDEGRFLRNLVRHLTTPADADAAPH